MIEFESKPQYGRAMLAKSLETNASRWKSAIQEYQTLAWRQLEENALQGKKESDDSFRRRLLWNLVDSGLQPKMTECIERADVFAFFMHKLGKADGNTFFTPKLNKLFGKILNEGRIKTLEEKIAAKEEKEEATAELKKRRWSVISTTIITTANFNECLVEIAALTAIGKVENLSYGWRSWQRRQFQDD